MVTQCRGQSTAVGNRATYTYQTMNDIMFDPLHGIHETVTHEFNEETMGGRKFVQSALWLQTNEKELPNDAIETDERAQE